MLVTTFLYMIDSEERDFCFFATRTLTAIDLNDLPTIALMTFAGIPRMFFS